MEGLLEELVEHCAERFGPAERGATYGRLKRALAEADEAPAGLVALYALLSAPLARSDKVAPLGLATVQRLYWAGCPSAVGQLVAWRDESEVLALLRGDCGGRAVVAAVAAGRLKRALAKGRPLSRPMLELCLSCAGAEAAASLTEGGAGALQPVRSRFAVAEGRTMTVEWRQQFSTVAETVWPASLALAEALARDRLAEGLQVAELGCGTGLAGIAAMKAGGAASVVLTDCSADGLELAQRNLALSGCEGRTLLLDWEEDESELVADVLLLADCWYHQVTHLRHALAMTVSRLLKRTPGSVAWCFAADRQDGAVQLFRAAFEEAGLRVRAVPVVRVAVEEALFPLETTLELLSFEVRSAE